MGGGGGEHGGSGHAGAPKGGEAFSERNAESYGETRLGHEAARHISHNFEKRWGETPVILGNVGAGLQGKLCTCLELCRWLAFTKHVVCKGNCVEAELPWQLRRWPLAQAGSRACKPSHHVQWKEHWPEQHGEALHSGNCRTVLFPCYNESNRTAQHKQFAPPPPPDKNKLACVYTGPTAVRVTREGWLRWRRRRETMRVAEGKDVLRGRWWVVTKNKCGLGVHGWEEGRR